MTTTVGTPATGPKPEQTPRQFYRPRPLPGLRLATALFILIYWLFFGFLLQEIDLNQPPAWWQNVLGSFPLLGLIPTPLITFLSQALSPRLLRHIVIPGLIGWWFANQAATGFLQKFYNFPTRANAANFLSRLQESSKQVVYESSTVSAPASRRVVRPTTALTLISLPFAALFLLLLIFSILIPPPGGTSIYGILLIIMGGVWAVSVVAYLVNHFVGGAPAPSGVRLASESLADLRRSSALLRVGGPGKVIVGQSNAIVSEYNGHFSRVLGPGIQRLRPYEYVRSIVDLRVQERQELISAITHDGVEVTAEIAVSFRISNDDRHFSGDDALNQVPTENARYPTRDCPYPFGEKAVRAAAYAETVRGDGEVLTWLSLPLVVATVEFRRTLGERHLESLFDPEADNPATHPLLLKQVTERSRRTLRHYGINLISLRLGPLQASEAVMTQNLTAWRRYWGKEQTLRQAQAYADTALAKEVARQQPETALLRAVVQAIEQARREGAVHLTQYVVALRLIEALERATQALEQDDPGYEPLREQLQTLHRRLALAQDSSPGALESGADRQ